MNSWTPDDVRKYCERNSMPIPDGLSAAPKKSKYGNKRTELNGKVYDSKREATRAAELSLLVKSGEIAAVFEQVRYTLAGGVAYIADFVILHWDGTYTIEDAKGVRTKEYGIKKRLMANKGLKITEV